MLRLLKNLFAGRQSIHALAASGDTDAFVNALGSMKLIMLGSLMQDGLSLESLTEAAFLAALERAAEELSTRKEFSAFVYSDDGTTYLPFFITQEAAGAFCGAYCDRENRLFQFHGFVFDARMLAACAMPETCIVMNPQSDDEFKLTDSQLLN